MYETTNIKPCHFQVPIVLKSGSLNILEPSAAVKACNEIALPLIYLILYNSVSQTFFKWGLLLSVRMFYGPPYSCPV
jgi:hypothetical protein